MWGLYQDNSLGDRVKVAVIASGLDEKTKTVALVEDAEFNRQMESYYGVKRQEMKPANPEPDIAPVEEEESAIAVSADEGETTQTKGNNLIIKIKNELEKFVEKWTEEEEGGEY